MINNPIAEKMERAAKSCDRKQSFPLRIKKSPYSICCMTCGQIYNDDIPFITFDTFGGLLLMCPVCHSGHAVRKFFTADLQNWIKEMDTPDHKRYRETNNITLLPQNVYGIKQVWNWAQ